MNAHIDRAHSEIGASSAHRWVLCPASVSLSRGIEGTTSGFAEEGTCAHELAEAALDNKIPVSSFIGQKFNGVTVTQEMADYIQSYVDRLQSYIHGDYDTYLEEKFHLKEIHEDMYGSNDFCAMGLHNGELVVVDLKYGKGNRVLAQNNIQLIIYALGAYYDSNFIYDFTKVRLVIAQPRVEGSEWDEWVITIPELLAYEPLLKEAIAEVYSNNPRAIPGDAQCKYCKAKPTCKALKNKTEEVIGHAFDSVPVTTTPTLPAANTLSVEQVVNVLTHSKLIEDWMASVAGYAQGLLERGVEVPGFKLVQKKTNRKVRDEKELLEAFHGTFGDKIVRTQLETLSVLEKVIGKKELESYLTKPVGELQIASISDKRPAIEPKLESAEIAFTETEDFNTMEF